MDSSYQQLIARPASAALDTQAKALSDEQGASEEVCAPETSSLFSRSAQARFRRLEDSIPCLLWELSGEGMLQHCSRQFIEYAGLSGQEQPADWLNAVHPEDLPLAQDAWTHAVSSGRDYKAELRLRRGDGQYLWHLCRARPVTTASGIIERWIMAAFDIHERRMSEAVLRQVDQRKDEFLSILGHELRNPVAAISSAVNLLKKNGGTEREQWVREVLEQQTVQICRLLDVLLDLSRLVRGSITLTLATVSAEEAARSAAAAVESRMKHKSHSFSLEAPPGPLYIRADACRVQEMLVQLLDNAARYTKKGGRIVLKVAEEHNQVVFSVCDNGPGIPEEDQAIIFDLFWQIDSELQNARKGLGLGLTLVKILANLHGGEASVQSEGAGQGSVFTLRFPLVEAPTEASGEAKADSEPSPGLQIMLVEDNREVAAMMSMILRGRKHQVEIVYDGKQALDVASRKRPQIILLDIGLPGMNGYEVVRKMRAELGLTDSLIVATTAYAQDKDVKNSREAGIDYHLVKPFQYETLANVVSKWQKNRAAAVDEASAASADVNPASTPHC